MAQKCKLSLGACTFIPGLKVHPEAILKENEHFTNKQANKQNPKTLSLEGNVILFMRPEETA